jgi:hypothetical protein
MPEMTPEAQDFEAQKLEAAKAALGVEDHQVVAAAKAAVAAGIQETFGDVPEVDFCTVCGEDFEWCPALCLGRPTTGGRHR